MPARIEAVKGGEVGSGVGVRFEEVGVKMQVDDLKFRFLSAQGDDAVTEAFDAWMEGDAEACVRLKAPLIKVVNGDRWFFHLTEDLRELEATTVVGCMCLQLIMKCDLLTQSLTDVPEQGLLEMRSLVARQCSVYYYG